jgi:hypothetical protein
VSEGIKVATTDAVPEGEGIAIPKAVTGTDDDMGASVDRFGTRPTVVIGLLGLMVLMPLLGISVPVYVAAAAVVLLLVWNNSCYIAVATMVTGAGEAAG